MNYKNKTKICTSCESNQAFFARSFSGELLCKNCFCKSIESKVKSTISKYKMFNYDDKIALALSGGKDSVNLLHILSRIQKNQKKSSIIAIIIDEGIQNYRDEALDIAISNCKDLGIDYKITSFKEIYGFTLDEIMLRRDNDKKQSSCAICGILRRKAINYSARFVKANKIVTAHTLDDEIQTILLNIFNGDLTRLIKGSPVSQVSNSCFVQRVKPFCEILEKESTVYAYVKKIRFQNHPCPYSSEAMRNDVRFILNYMEEKHAGTKFTIFRTIEKIRPSLEQTKRKNRFIECKICGEASSFGICKACEILSGLN